MSKFSVNETLVFMIFVINKRKAEVTVSHCGSGELRCFAAVHWVKKRDYVKCLFY